MNRRRALSVLLAAPWWTACKSRQTLVPRAGRPVDVSTADTAPLEVLPSGALLAWRLDAEPLFRTSFGGQVAQLVSTVLPLGPESGFSPARDVKRVYGAAYAMQGADFAAIVQGTFDTAALQRAAQQRAATPSGAPVVETQYAGFGMYTVSNMGFVALTPTTMLAGNETGLRRTLDRLRHGSEQRGLAAWMTELLAGHDGELAFAGDLRRQGVVAAADDRLPFLRGLERLRGVGNFAAPGMNLVGNIAYRDEPAALAGAQTLTEVRRLAYFVSLMTNFGVGGGSAPEVSAQAFGKNVSFATAIDAQLMGTMLGMTQKLLTPGSGGVF